MTDEQLPVFIFDDFQVEPATFQILKAGAQVQLEPKTLKLLLFFIENRYCLESQEANDGSKALPDFKTP